MTISRHSHHGCQDNDEAERLTDSLSHALSPFGTRFLGRLYI